MVSYALSGEADRDIEGIARDTIDRWGLLRAETYILGLHRTFDHLATFPELGRSISHIRPGYRRIESARHVVFYRETDAGVLIVRVLHERMDMTSHL